MPTESNKEIIYVTKEGLIDLNKELEKLVNIERQEVIEDLQNARAMGDLSENADYDAARDRQARVEARIRDLESMLLHSELIQEKKGHSRTIKIGSTFEIKDFTTEEIEIFTIVGSVEADPIHGKLSNLAPLAMALLDHKVGDVVEINVKVPYKVKIISIN